MSKESKFLEVESWVLEYRNGTYWTPQLQIEMAVQRSASGKPHTWTGDLAIIEAFWTPSGWQPKDEWVTSKLTDAKYKQDVLVFVKNQFFGWKGEITPKKKRKVRK